MNADKEKDKLKDKAAEKDKEETYEAIDFDKIIDYVMEEYFEVFLIFFFWHLLIK